MVASVEKARVDHRVADCRAGRGRDLHHREPKLVLQLVDQRQGVFHAGRVRLDEERIVERRQPVLQFQGRA